MGDQLRVIFDTISKDTSMSEKPGSQTASDILKGTDRRRRATSCERSTTCSARNPSKSENDSFPTAPALIKRCRQTAAGDQLRVLYDTLSKDPNSLANLDQDLPNYAQHQVNMII